MKSQFLVRDNEEDVVLYGVSLGEASTFIEDNRDLGPFKVCEIEAGSITEMSKYLH